MHEFSLERIFFLYFVRSPPRKFSNGRSLNIPGLTFSHFVIYTINWALVIQIGFVQHAWPI